MIPKAEDQTVDFHLQQAMSHLEMALNKSMQAVLQKESSQKEQAQIWEGFLGRFFAAVRDMGKLHRINLLGWISFQRIMKG